MKNILVSVIVTLMITTPLKKLIAKDPQKITVGLYTRTFYNIEENRRQFSVNFKLWLLHPQEITKPFKKIQFIDAISLESKLLEQNDLPNGKKRSLYFIRGTFLAKNPFKKDPFKEQKITLRIKPFMKNAKNLLLEPDLKGTYLLSAEAQKSLEGSWKTLGENFQKSLIDWPESGGNPFEKNKGNFSLLTATVYVRRYMSKFSFEYLYYKIKNIFS